jgi:hypothetical protein
MENTDCGIAASADPAARAGKIRYDLEMNWKFQFFSQRSPFGRANRGLEFANRAPNLQIFIARLENWQN